MEAKRETRGVVKPPPKIPEGPETLKQVDFLLSLFAAGLQSYHFVGLEVLSDRFPDLNLNALRRALDKPLLDVFCKGKTYFLVLSEGVFLTAHHGMKGKWLTESGQKNTHVKLSFARFKYEDGEPIEVLEEINLFWQNERFGAFEIGLGMGKLEDKLLELADGFIGRSQLTQGGWDLSVGGFGPRKKVRDALMDQHCLCSGIGNYLCAEIFYAAKLHPDALFSKLTAQQKSSLFTTCQSIVRGHYEGTREKQIYKQKIAPCGTEIVTEKFGQRTFHWVPSVQTLGV